MAAQNSQEAAQLGTYITKFKHDESQTCLSPNNCIDFLPTPYVLAQHVNGLSEKGLERMIPEDGNLEETISVRKSLWRSLDSQRKQEIAK